ncbi:hypothetical protein GCM10019059_43290 [Camelimonas fluminis]|nr:hypothetical protein GCM10019059_43290 [Camelimonas fluminis]
MQDNRGRMLTAFTTLGRDGNYRSTLKYDDGQVVEHSGKYRVRFSKLDVRSSVRLTSGVVAEAHAIDAAAKSEFPKEYASFAAAVPVGIKSGDSCVCTVGEVTYDVKSWNPRSLEFGAPQTFKFVVVADGYVRVSGPGVNDALSRRYAYR